jgi:hypothetical protein
MASVELDLNTVSPLAMPVSCELLLSRSTSPASYLAAQIQPAPVRSPDVAPVPGSDADPEFLVSGQGLFSRKLRF